MLMPERDPLVTDLGNEDPTGSFVASISSFAENQHVEILFLPLGGGHRATAEALSERLKMAGVACSVSNLAADLGIDRWLVKAYRWCLQRKGAWAHRLLYGLSNRHPQGVLRLLAVVFGGRIARLRYLSEARVIVSTFPGLSAVIERTGRAANAKFVDVITDGGKVNSLWLATPACLIAAHETVLGSHAELNVRPVVAIPQIVSAEYSRLAPKAVARGRLGLLNAPTVLLNAGGAGYGPNLRLVVQALQKCNGLQVLLATGSNIALYRELSHALEGLKVLDCSQGSLADAVASSDLIVGKAGWLSLNEAAVARRRYIIVDAIPGQEVENARIASLMGWAEARSVRDVIHEVNRLCERASLV